MCAPDTHPDGVGLGSKGNMHPNGCAGQIIPASMDVGRSTGAVVRAKRAAIPALQVHDVAIGVAAQVVVKLHRDRVWSGAKYIPTAVIRWAIPQSAEARGAGWAVGASSVFESAEASSIQADPARTSTRHRLTTITRRVMLLGFILVPPCLEYLFSFSIELESGEFSKPAYVAVCDAFEPPDMGVDNVEMTRILLKNPNSPESSIEHERPGTLLLRQSTVTRTQMKPAAHQGEPLMTSGR